MLSTHNLVVAAGDTQILNNVTIHINKNNTCALLGESGSGKTTFALAVSALLPSGVSIKSGTILYKGKQTDYNDLKSLRGKHIFYTPQNAAASLNPVLKIKHQIQETSRLIQNELLELMHSLDFSDPEQVLNAYPFELSDGENRRCLLAMAAALQPEVLILDEPTHGLDCDAQQKFTGLIRKVQQQYGFSILLISHNLTVASELADYIYIIKQGEIVDEGIPEDLFAAPSHAYTKEIVSLLEDFMFSDVET